MHDSNRADDSAPAGPADNCIVCGRESTAQSECFNCTLAEAVRSIPDNQPEPHPLILTESEYQAIVEPFRRAKFIAELTPCAITQSFDLRGP